MKKYFSLIAVFLMASASALASEKLRVVATYETFAEIGRQVGGPNVEVKALANGSWDPHFVDAKPSYLVALHKADALLLNGLELEVGFLPPLLQQSGNAKIQAGAPGYVDLSRFIAPIEIPKGGVDRSMGDIHPYGNPHTETDPHNVGRVADEVARRLAAIDPAGAATYQARGADFSKRWTSAIAGWERRAAPLRGMEIVTHHVAWVYLAHWLGLVDVAHLEPKPGIPPSASSLAQLLATLAGHHPRAIVRLAYEPERPSLWLSERLTIPALVLPHAPAATDDAKDLFTLYDGVIDRLLKAQRP